MTFIIIKKLKLKIFLMFMFLGMYWLILGLLVNFIHFIFEIIYYFFYFVCFECIDEHVIKEKATRYVYP